LFGLLWYTFPSLPTIFRPRHWFAGNGGLFRDVYFAVVCSSHDFVFCFDFLEVDFFDFLDVDFFDFLDVDFGFGFDFEAFGAFGALGLFEGREADLTLGLFEALDFRTDFDFDFGFGLDFDFGAERAPDLAETRTGICGFFSWGLELRFFNGPRIKKFMRPDGAPCHQTEFLPRRDGSWDEAGGRSIETLEPSRTTAKRAC
jgi:hypothetical protein